MPLGIELRFQIVYTNHNCADSGAYCPGMAWNRMEQKKKARETMSKIAIFLADGFEEIEGLTVVDICRRCGLTIDMVSITEDRQVMGSHKIPVTAAQVRRNWSF